MAYSETKEIDQITIASDGGVFYRETTTVLKDGVQIAQTYHRYSLLPGQDLAGQPESVVAHCNVAWTPEVVAAFQAKLANAGN